MFEEPNAVQNYFKHYRKYRSFINVCCMKCFNCVFEIMKCFN